MIDEQWQFELFEYRCPFCGLYDWYGGDTTEYECGEDLCIPLQDSLMMLADIGKVKTIYMGDVESRTPKTDILHKELLEWGELCHDSIVNMKLPDVDVSDIVWPEDVYKQEDK